MELVHEFLQVGPGREKGRSTAQRLGADGPEYAWVSLAALIDTSEMYDLAAGRGLYISIKLALVSQ